MYRLQCAILRNTSNIYHHLITWSHQAERLAPSNQDTLYQRPLPKLHVKLKHRSSKLNHCNYSIYYHPY